MGTETGSWRWVCLSRSCKFRNISKQCLRHLWSQAVCSAVTGMSVYMMIYNTACITCCRSSFSSSPSPPLTPLPTPLSLSFVQSFTVAFRPQRPYYGLLGTREPRRSPRLSHSSRALSSVSSRSSVLLDVHRDRTDTQGREAQDGHLHLHTLNSWALTELSCKNVA